MMEGGLSGLHSTVIIMDDVDVMDAVASGPRDVERGVPDDGPLTGAPCTGKEAAYGVMHDLHRLPEHSTPREPGDTACLDCGACCAVPSQLSPRAWWLQIEAAQRRTDGTLVTFGPDRCEALAGKVGIHVRCACYARRPSVCRAFVVGGPSCQEARRLFGLPPL